MSNWEMNLVYLVGGLSFALVLVVLLGVMAIRRDFDKRLEAHR